MKSDHQDNQQKTFQFDHYNEETNNKHIFCLKYNPAFQMCVNEQCKSFPIFTCGADKCECQKQHNQCIRINVDTVLDKIRSKLTSGYKQFIEETFDKLMDRLSQFRDHLLNQGDQKLKFVRLHDLENMLLKISRNQAENTSINSFESAMLWKISQYKSQVRNQEVQKLQNDLRVFESSIEQLIFQTNLQLAKMIDKSRTITSDTIRLFQTLKKESRIFETITPIQKLIKMFPRKIKSFKLDFSASLNNFSLQKYIEKCGNATDTVIVVLNEKDKVFGGYTPLCFVNGDNQLDIDIEKRSFLFSLSEDQKFELRDPNYAIYRITQKNQKIQFGNDFQICDKANTNPNCIVGYQYYYKNEKYKNGKEASFRLNGRQNYSCTLKEWQVFKVEFQK